MNYRQLLCFSSIFCLVLIGSASGQGQTGWQFLQIDRVMPQQAREAAKVALGMSETPVSAAVLRDLRPQVLHASKRGSKIVRFKRYVDGIEVYAQQATVLLGKDGQPMAMRHNLKSIAPASPAANTGFDKLESSKYWVEHDGKLIAATLEYSTVKAEQGSDMIAELKSWPAGKILKSGSVTDRISFDYRVYDGDDPFGHSQPHPTGVPDGFRPTVAVPQVLLNIEELSDLSNDPWLPETATETLGNNVDSFFNSIREPDGSCDFVFDPAGAWAFNLAATEGDFRAQASGNVFDYVYNEAISSSDFFHSFSDCPIPDSADPQINAKIVQTFYWANLMHDLFYDAGFDEVSGNAQQDNYGRGGMGSDRMIIHASAPTTFVSTPADGDSPIMVIGLNSTSSSRRDTSLDLSVFAHEWGHYMVRRLVGGASFLTTTQSRSLNEGWADFIGVLMNVKAADFEGSAPGATSSYAVGSYMNQDYAFFLSVLTSTGLSDSYFYGIRRWPYGSSNPLSFRHIEHGQSLPAGFDFFDWKSRSTLNAEVHTAGEIWAATLWDCARSIFVNRADQGFSENRAHIAEYLVAGMKLTPSDPTFLEARDALLLAMRTLDENDFMLCRAAFSARGMGSGSLSPARDSKGLSNVVESFANDDFAISVVESSLKDNVASIDHDSILDQGETGTLSIRIRNTGFESIRKLTVSPVNSPDYQIGRTTRVRNLMPGAEQTIEFQVKLLHGRDYDATDFPLNWKAQNGRARATGALHLSHRTHFDIRNWKGADNAEFSETFSDWQTKDVAFEARSMDNTWERRHISGNTVYAAGEEYAAYDQALVSPPILVSDEFDFRVTFDHAFQFQRTLADGAVAYKGNGLLDISTDDGSTWTNLTSFAGNSAGFPSLANEEINLGSTYALQTVRLRFRLQSSTALIFDGISTHVAVPVDEAWYIDNIQFWGIFGEPLTRVFDENGF